MISVLREAKKITSIGCEIWELLYTLLLGITLRTTKIITQLNIDLLLREYNNIIPIRDFAEYTIGGTRFASRLDEQGK